MKALLPLIGILAVASLTPGPNNLLVMRAAAEGRGAVARAIGGVLAGSLLLLALVAAGVGTLFMRWPAVTTTIAIGGSLWLAWMGVRLGWPPPADAPVSPAFVPRNSVGSVAAFQLTNPKAWLLVATAVAALPPLTGIATVALLMVVISGASLLIWSAAGMLIESRLESATARRRFDRAMGMALMVSALGGIWHVID